MPLYIVNIIYLIAAVLFIFGLKGLAHPRTAVAGNLLSAVGMLLAVMVTVLHRDIVSYDLIIAGLLGGAVVGTVLALKIHMTAMPQLVAVFNGFGGGASVLVAGAALFEKVSLGQVPTTTFLVATVASCLIGSVTFMGSLVAFAKLQGLIFEQALSFPGLKILQIALGIASLGSGLWLGFCPEQSVNFWGLAVVSLVLGIFLVLPIGGADMPVVIALLNSYSGLAAAATGFVLTNNVLIISGSLVGASGLILTKLMCRAMNRSLANVLFGGLGGAAVAGAGEDDVYGGHVKATSAEEVALLLESAHRVVIVPGYGLAVAQAQHAVRELAELLKARNVQVEYGIHPVAGRMPGHMNVLLAEANVPYDQLREMDEINPTFGQTDVAIVIGANDVVNPVARQGKNSPIAGMPILNVDQARTVVVIKRSLSPGFAGIPNPLFAAQNTLMLFGDAKKMMLDLVSALKEM